MPTVFFTKCASKFISKNTKRNGQSIKNKKLPKSQTEHKIADVLDMLTFRKLTISPRIITNGSEPGGTRPSGRRPFCCS